MVVKIRLARFGKRHAPFYNIVVANARYVAAQSKPTIHIHMLSWLLQNRYRWLCTNNVAEQHATANLSKSSAPTIRFPKHPPTVKAVNSRTSNSTPQGQSIGLVLERSLLIRHGDYCQWYLRFFVVFRVG